MNMGAIDTKKQYKRIVECWHKIEHFSPCEIKRGDYIEITSDSSLPWLKESYSRKLNERYKIRLGVFKLVYAMEDIRRYLKDTEEEIEKVTDKTCFGELEVNNDGTIVENSLKLSTLPWAVGCVLNNKLYLSNWSEEFARYEILVNDVIKDMAEKKCRLGGFKNIVKKMCDLAKWGNHLDCRFYLQKIETKKGSKALEAAPNKPLDKEEEDGKHNVSDDEPDKYLNNFFISDLERVLKAIDRNLIGPALQMYLCTDNYMPRIDLGTRKENLKGIVSPDRLPYGRWPSEHSLYLMQQSAVNLVISELFENKGMISVNGPPGTGKTTLLKDIIAAVITLRAEALLEYNDPKEAFKKIGEVSVKNNISIPVHAPDIKTTGQGIIVASSNNKAVENISKELPLMKAMSNKYISHSGADYFRDIANNVAGEESWGLIAAVLGNDKNCDKFKKSFWFVNASGKTMQDFLKTLNNSSKNENRIIEWNAAKRSYWDALTKVQTLLDKINDYKKTVERCDSLFEKHRETKLEAEIAENSTRQIEEKYQNEDILLQEESQQLEESFNRLRNNLEMLKKTRPCLLHFLFNTPSARSYKNLYNGFKAKYHEAARQYQEHEKEHRALWVEVNNQKRKLFDLQREIKKAEITHKECLESLDNVKISFKGPLPDRYSESKPLFDIQTSSPWITDELNEARAELFLEALNVHKAFVIASKKEIQNNLSLFIDMLKNKDFIATNKEYVQHLWNTFFLVVPVMSTTFASVERLFRGMESESIGWLFIDEAGQAVPQAAVGAIWRSNRVVVVGDPLQIEPVVTIPESIMRDIREHYGVIGEMASKSSSIQAVADRSNRYGTYLEGGETKNWVGCPLRVHRRCISPMFDVSNDIAYNGLMVKATPEPEGKHFPVGESRWIHVEGESKPAHWVPVQGEVVIKLLRDVFQCAKEHGERLPSLYIITPFVTVKQELEKKVREFLRKQRLLIDKKDQENWINESIGTVHTFQGKEADTVIFCLGIDKKTGRGAARWTASKPNILNVAITRARYRFVVIGDIDLWGELLYFRELIKYLPVEKWG